MYRLYLKQEAEYEILNAAQYYDEQQQGLGNRFVDDVEALFAYIEKNPLSFPRNILLFSRRL